MNQLIQLIHKAVSISSIFLIIRKPIGPAQRMPKHRTVLLDGPCQTIKESAFKMSKNCIKTPNSTDCMRFEVKSD